MSTEWAKNHMGFHLDDEQMKKIPYPMTELVVHVTIKNVQAFGLLGTLLVGPIVAALNSATRSVAGIRLSATKYGKYGVLLGLVTGPLMTYGRVSSGKVDHNGLYDRCYRLRNNRGQVRVDRASVLGAVGGAGISAATGGCLIFGSLVGMSAGIIGMAIYNNKIAVEIKKKK